MRTIWLGTTDEHGASSAVGELVSHHGDHGQGTGYFHWDWNGAAATERTVTHRNDVLDALQAAGSGVDGRLSARVVRIAAAA